MIQPLFNPHYSWVAGAVYGAVAGTLGALAGWLVPQGRARRWVLGAWFAVWGLGIAQLLLAFLALHEGQPRDIWYGLLIPGVIGTFAFGANTWILYKGYSIAEQRRLAAKDFAG